MNTVSSVVVLQTGLGFETTHQWCWWQGFPFGPVTNLHEIVLCLVLILAEEDSNIFSTPPNTKTLFPWTSICFQCHAFIYLFMWNNTCKFQVTMLNTSSYVQNKIVQIFVMHRCICSQKVAWAYVLCTYLYKIIIPNVVLNPPIHFVSHSLCRLWTPDQNTHMCSPRFFHTNMCSWTSLCAQDHCHAGTCLYYASKNGNCNTAYIDR